MRNGETRDMLMEVEGEKNEERKEREGGRLFSKDQ